MYYVILSSIVTVNNVPQSKVSVFSATTLGQAEETANNLVAVGGQAIITKQLGIVTKTRTSSTDVISTPDPIVDC